MATHAAKHHKISEFARLAQVSVRTLHYYDSVDLLKPAYIDPDSGYRYYTLDQIRVLNRIRALRNLELSIQDVRQCLNEQVSTEQIQVILRARQDKLRMRIAEDQARIRETEARIHALTHQDTRPILDVVFKQVPAESAMICEVVLTSDEVIAHIFYECADALRSAHRYSRHTAVSCVYLHHQAHHQGVVQKPRHILAAFVMPAQDLLPIPLSKGRLLQPGCLPSHQQVLCTLHQGPDFDRDAAHDALLDWSIMHGYQVSAAPREVYFRRGQPNEYLTEIQFPVRPLVQSMPNVPA
jgi:DNA-binding transcriptional MerR regulator